MAQYIDKDAIIAEMNKLLDKGKYHDEYEYAFRDGNNGALYALKRKLDTLEVKEVDSNDAFIEKAVSYLNSKLYDWVQTTNPNQKSYANIIMKPDFIEGFRNYMKEV